MRKFVLPLSAAGAAIAVAAFALPSVGSAEDEVPRWQTAQSIGEPRNCIPLRQIRSTRVHDDRTIDFYVSGGRIYRNTLPYDCSGLGFEEAFSYETSLSQLCSSDIITVFRASGGPHGPSCGLGQFQQIEYPADPAESE